MGRLPPGLAAATVSIQLAVVGALMATDGELRPGGTPALVLGALAVLTTLALLALLVRSRGSIPSAKKDGRDALTGLATRLRFDEAFQAELERARRTGTGLSVIAADVDRLGSLNDAHGHAAGDAALREVGRAIRTSTRSWDVAARVGGEEFALLAPETDAHGAYVLCERIRAAIERAGASGQDEPLTVSFGVASHPADGYTAEALLHVADRALYAAKRLGGNRCVISGAEVAGILSSRTAPDRGKPVDLGALLAIAEALDMRDSGSATHCHRVGRYAELTARELGLSPASVERIRLAGVLHDVGRVGMPDELVRRDGPLSQEEWQCVRSHPEIGARMVATTDSQDIGAWILAHHERPDGKGYPAGANAEHLPLEGAIVGVADAYEAMTADRPYRSALDPQAASEELRRGAGRQWDERAVGALLRVV